MTQEMDSLKYFIAAEKIGSLLLSLEMALEFIDEFKIKPDDEVKRCLKPALEKMMHWIK
jgi:hypothetical protein